MNTHTICDLHSAFHFLFTEAKSVFPLSPAADWWSVGAILFELLTRKVIPMLFGENYIVSFLFMTVSDRMDIEYKSVFLKSSLGNLYYFIQDNLLKSSIEGREWT